MVAADPVFDAVGTAVNLLSRSRYHRQFALGLYLAVEIYPAIKAGQVHFIRDARGEPRGMLTWAWLSDAALADIVATGRSIWHDEWTCGDTLLVNDLISPGGSVVRDLMDIRRKLFGHVRSGYTFRRHGDGSVRRVVPLFNPTYRAAGETA